MKNLEIKIIKKEKAKEWIINKHYAKRMAPITYLYGLIKNGEIIGICSFGTPASNAIRSIYTDYKVLELNRLCVNDGLPKNTLSFFVEAVNQTFD